MRRTQVISFSSGKGGVGKSALVVNLAHCLARRGKRVLAVDGDWALGKLGILFGVRPLHTVVDVLRGKVALTGAITPVTRNLDLLAAPSGNPEMVELGEAVRNRLFYELDSLDDGYDFLLMDHGSGAHWDALQFVAAAHQHIVMTTTEPTSYTDAYAIMKLLSTRYALREFHLLVTQSRDRARTQAVGARLHDLAASRLGVRVRHLEACPWDSRVSESIIRRRAFVDLFPDSELASVMGRLAGGLGIEIRPSGKLSFFFEATNSYRG